MTLMRRRRRNQLLDQVMTLRASDLPRLRANSHARLGPGDAEAILASMPGLSKWHPASGEFALVSPWRHRADIPTIELLVARSYEDELIAAVVEEAHAQNKAGIVLMEMYERRRPDFYEKNRFDLLESIVTYEHGDPQALIDNVSPSGIVFHPVHSFDLTMLQAVQALDEAAFPWLWRNTPDEFRAYLSMPNIEIFAGFIGDDLVAYYGITHYLRWGHLDRIAVAPGLQHRGLGKATLRSATERMVQLGADRVGLSTQRSNDISRHMYERAGFRHTPESDYAVYGQLFHGATKTSMTNRGEDDQ